MTEACPQAQGQTEVVETGCAGGIIAHVEHAGLGQRVVGIIKIRLLEASPGEQGFGVHATFFQHVWQDNQHATTLNAEITQSLC